MAWQTRRTGASASKPWLMPRGTKLDSATLTPQYWRSAGDELMHVILRY
jgi:hypothetical protein